MHWALKADGTTNVMSMSTTINIDLRGIENPIGCGFQCYPVAFSQHDIAVESRRAHFLVQWRKKGIYLPISLVRCWQGYQLGLARG